jgi:hypothetical protein
MKMRKIPKIASIIPTMRRRRSRGREAPMKARIIQRTPNITPITGYMIDFILPKTGSLGDVSLPTAGVDGLATRNPGGQLQPSVEHTEVASVSLLPQSKFRRAEPFVEESKLVIQTGEFGQSCLCTSSKSFESFGSKVPEQQKFTA